MFCNVCKGAQQTLGPIGAHPIFCFILTDLTGEVLFWHNSHQSDCTWGKFNFDCINNNKKTRGGHVRPRVTEFYDFFKKWI